MTGLDEQHVRDVARKHCRVNGITDSADQRLADAIVGAFAELHPEVQLLTEMQVLRLEPGDILVLSTDEALIAEHVDHLRQEMRAQFPNNKITVLERLQLAVVRPGQETPA